MQFWFLIHYAKLFCLMKVMEGGKVAVEGNGKEGEKSKDDVTIELHAVESSRNLPWYIVDVVMRISSDL